MQKIMRAELTAVSELVGFFEFIYYIKYENDDVEALK
jgi:hypothetical protein